MKTAVFAGVFALALTAYALRTPVGLAKAPVEARVVLGTPEVLGDAYGAPHGPTEAELGLLEPRFDTVRANAASAAGVPRALIAYDWAVEERVDLARTEDTALALARLCWSEEGLDDAIGCDALWQTVLNVRERRCDVGTRSDRPGRVPLLISQCAGPDGEILDVRPGEHHPGYEETPLSALRRLSRFVTGMAPPARGRQAWLSSLDRSGDPPTSWRECTGGDGPCDGTWRHYAAQWEALLTQAQDRVDRGRAVRVCGGHPIAWGGEMDRPIMARRNAARARAGIPPLVELDCGLDPGLRDNRYYGRAPQQILASATE